MTRNQIINGFLIIGIALVLSPALIAAYAVSPLLLAFFVGILIIIGATAAL